MPRHAAAAFVKLHCLVDGYIFAAPTVMRTLLETSWAASTNFLSSTALGRPTFFGSTSPLASFHLPSETYTPRPCASHTLVTEQTKRAVVQRRPHLLLPWTWAWPCNSLRAGSEVQQRHALGLSQKVHNLCLQLPVSAEQAAQHLNSMASLNHQINQLVVRLFPHE